MIKLVIPDLLTVINLSNCFVVSAMHQYAYHYVMQGLNQQNLKEVDHHTISYGVETDR